MLIRIPDFTVGEFFTVYQSPYDMPSDFIDAHAHYTHEYQHFMTFTSTGFGQLVTQIRVYQLSVIRDVVTAIAAMDATDYSTAPMLPLRTWLENDPCAENAIPNEARMRLRLCRDCESFIDVLNGDAAIESLRPGAFKFFIDAEPARQPEITCERGHQHLLGARALIEAAAEISEYHVRMSMSSTEVAFESIAKTMVAMGIAGADVNIDGYPFRWSSTSFFPADDCLTLAPGRLLAKRCPSLTKSQVLLLLPVLCDLALSMPQEPPPGRLVRPDVAWKDLHPGYRFLAIVDYIDGIASDDRRLGDAGVYAGLVHEICEHYGWETPDDGARAVLEADGFIPAHAHFFRRAARLRLAAAKVLLQPFLDPHHVNIYLRYGPVPHVVFADAYQPYGPGDPRVPGLEEIGIPDDIRQTLLTVMTLEGTFDAMFRRAKVACVFKASRFECGLPQHEQCDACLRDAQAPVCAVARDQYTQFGVWNLLRRAVGSVSP